MKNAVWRFFGSIGIIVTVFFVIILIFAFKGMNSFYDGPAVIKKEALLVLDLRGIIIDGRRFLKELRRYRDDDNIKGVIVRIDSPGGVVGPSQEIFAELKKTREELKKPVIASVNGVAASGAYYAAVAADKIITNPGSIMGSIGVIMEFANLEGLYSWAKIQRYSLKTGKYKDAGADYRRMTEDERHLLQGMIDEVLEQFVKAVADGRKLTADRVRQIADGRIITGETSVKLGLADQVGTFSDAVKIAGEMSGLGAEPELFMPQLERPSPFDLLRSFEEEDNGENSISKVIDQVTQRQLLGKPLFLMPGVAL